MKHFFRKIIKMRFNPGKKTQNISFFMRLTLDLLVYYHQHPTCIDLYYSISFFLWRNLPNYIILLGHYTYLFIVRENTNHWKVKKINSTEQRIAGLCPLTPKEVGIFLEALGYPPSTAIYIAAGEIYGGKTHLSDLTSRFPNLLFKVSPS